MAITWITPVERSNHLGAGWRNVDVSGDIPATATGVILHFHNTTGNSDQIGFRKNGSTDDRHRDTSWAHYWVAVGVDGSQIFEEYTEFGNLDTLNVWLVGYFEDDAVFLTNGTAYNAASTNLWLDVDITPDTAGDAIGAIFEIDATNTNDEHGIRKNGSTDARRSDAGSKHWAIIGLDVDEICEQNVSNTNVDMYLSGYITKEATFITNATDITNGIAINGWHDLATLPAGAIGGFIESDTTGGTRTAYGLRKDGSAEAIAGIFQDERCFGFVEAASRVSGGC